MRLQTICNGFPRIIPRKISFSCACVPATYHDQGGGRRRPFEKEFSQRKGLLTGLQNLSDRFRVQGLGSPAAMGTTSQLSS